MTAQQRPGRIDDLRQRRDESNRRRTQLRQQRWEQQRFAVPYPTDGPKITLGIAWFIAVVVSGWLSTLALALLVLVVAALAGFQVGRSFRPFVDPPIAAGLAGVLAAAGFFGALGLGIVLVLGAIITLLVATGLPSAAPVLGPRGVEAPPMDALVHRAELLARSSLPAGVAAASLVAIERLEFGAFIALVVLVSAYEVGDFLIGTGASNAVEGPVAGLVALVVAAATTYVLLPAPFDTNSYPLFAALAAVCAPLGQIAASAVLPRGVAWAPALRRLDSYLLAAPLWLLLLPRG